MPGLTMWSRGTQDVLVKQFNEVLNVLKFLEKQNKLIIKIPP